MQCNLIPISLKLLAKIAQYLSVLLSGWYNYVKFNREVTYHEALHFTLALVVLTIIMALPELDSLGRKIRLVLRWFMISLVFVNIIFLVVEGARDVPFTHAEYVICMAGGFVSVIVLNKLNVIRSKTN